MGGSKRQAIKSELHRSRRRQLLSADAVLFPGEGFEDVWK